MTTPAASDINKYTLQSAANKHCNRRKPYCAPDAPVIARVMVRWVCINNSPFYFCRAIGLMSHQWWMRLGLSTLRVIQMKGGISAAHPPIFSIGLVCLILANPTAHALLIDQSIFDAHHQSHHCSLLQYACRLRLTK